MGFEEGYMPGEYGGTIFHYTSPSGMQSILFNDPTCITLWASRFDCLNDISEGTIAEKVFGEVCDELKNSGEISESFYSIIRKVSPARTFPFWVTVNHVTRVTRDECDRFVTSMSKNSDSLAMWNYYSKGSKYEGFNLGFDPVCIKDSLVHRFSGKEIVTRIYPVVYKKEEQKNLIKPLILAIYETWATMDDDKYDSIVRCIVSDKLNDWKLIFKGEYFQHEEEVRIITDVAKRTKNGVQLPIEILYRYNCGLITPYVELKLNKECLTDITMGPLQCNGEQKDVQKKVISEMLSVHGYTAMEKVSEIPVRF
jgi:hypothetical protein